MPAKKLPRCEKCNSYLIAQIEKKRLWCQVCGHTRTDPEAIQILNAYISAGGVEVYAPEYIPTVRVNGPSQQQLELLEAAWDAIHQQDLKTARYMCEKLLSDDPLLIDAIFLQFLAAASRDDKVQHLLSILSIDPYHERANFELAKIKGVIDEKTPFKVSHTAVTPQQKAENVEAKGRIEQCPMCGGQTLYIAADEIRCRACGYTPNQQTEAILGQQPINPMLPLDGNYHSLQDALTQRKYGINREWHIAKRVLACQNCGAQLTLSGSMMTQQCAFCDSQYVLIRDAVGSFQEPDAVLPANLDQKQAEATIYQAAPQEIKQRVQRAQIVGIFLPFWCFRGVVSVDLNTTSYALPVNNILVSAGQEPGQPTLADLQPYDLTHLRPYDQRYLAHWSAGLYTMDAIQASITANAFAKYMALQSVNGVSRFDSAPFARTDGSYNPDNLAPRAQIISPLEYRLILLPAWMITLFLERGGYHHAMINAQTGEVIFTERVDSKGSYEARKNSESVIKPITPPLIRSLPPRP